MFIEDEEDFDLLGETTVEEDDNIEETSNEVDEAESEEDEKVNEETHDDEDETEDKSTQSAKDNKAKALSAERARRKAAEKELKELKAQIDAGKAAKENEDKIAKEREAYKAKMLEGDLVDEEVADKLLDVFGEDIIKTKIANQERVEEENFEKEFSELKNDELFMDADVYKPKIKELMGKGLTIEEAYGAAISSGRLAQIKKDLEIELEQKLLNNEKKTDAIDIGHSETKGETKRGKYTKREQEIARETGLSIEEVHKRYMKPGQVFSIDDIENL